MIAVCQSQRLLLLIVTTNTEDYQLDNYLLKSAHKLCRIHCTVHSHDL